MDNYNPFGLGKLAELYIKENKAYLISLGQEKRMENLVYLIARMARQKGVAQQFSDDGMDAYFIGAHAWNEVISDGE